MRDSPGGEVVTMFSSKSNFAWGLCYSNHPLRSIIAMYCVSGSNKGGSSDALMIGGCYGKKKETMGQTPAGSHGGCLGDCNPVRHPAVSGDRVFDRQRHPEKWHLRSALFGPGIDSSW